MVKNRKCWFQDIWILPKDLFFFFKDTLSRYSSIFARYFFKFFVNHTVKKKLNVSKNQFSTISQSRNIFLMTGNCSWKVFLAFLTYYTKMIFFRFQDIPTYFDRFEISTPSPPASPPPEGIVYGSWEILNIQKIHKFPHMIMGTQNDQQSHTFHF